MYDDLLGPAKPKQKWTIFFAKELHFDTGLTTATPFKVGDPSPTGKIYPLSVMDEAFGRAMNKKGELYLVSQKPKNVTVVEEVPPDWRV